ncbi:polyphosphate kinase 2 [Flavilitoribacter nigricans]|uniref:ADP/GDP-polyphosphate phosphotransferase n=1 Tax=Flavilitoribacter nigricans (strain ATCC 23147 / DSM 23189 / NBRC 102662 / NCIMB 1420 / SS-2) TaxID=1122177 RepID=A0A2D0N6S3_FLAN2|nr:polyphosphate kinase 2 [Flavilitoribacter nigricans]PHN04157.1 polyphosphate kinase 2 [Flavilitoribacter nigricans DSM 23189 = NBRC 102662]
MKRRTIEEFYQVDSRYIEELYFLQVELLKLQKHVHEQGLRLAIVFEGRDTAGKGAAIFRFSQFLNPRAYRIIALGKPTELERKQWYFQRYIKALPNAGEIVFFDRSWYNRAVVEPVMGFCSPEQYEMFMQQVCPLEKMLTEDGILLVKLWFSIDAQQQKERIKERQENPLKRWKVSPVDLAAQEKWDEFTTYKNSMFERTHSDYAPWVVIRGRTREESRIQAMRHLLSLIEFEGRSAELPPPDPEVLRLWDKI